MGILVPRIAKLEAAAMAWEAGAAAARDYNDVVMRSNAASHAACMSEEPHLVERYSQTDPAPARSPPQQAVVLEETATVNGCSAHGSFEPQGKYEHAEVPQSTKVSMYRRWRRRQRGRMAHQVCLGTQAENSATEGTLGAEGAKHSDDYELAYATAPAAADGRAEQVADTTGPDAHEAGENLIVDNEAIFMHTDPMGLLDPVAATAEATLDESDAGQLSDVQAEALLAQNADAPVTKQSQMNSLHLVDLGAADNIQKITADKATTSLQVDPMSAWRPTRMRCRADDDWIVNSGSKQAVSSSLDEHAANDSEHATKADCICAEYVEDADCIADGSYDSCRGDSSTFDAVPGEGLAANVASLAGRGGIHAPAPSPARVPAPVPSTAPMPGRADTPGESSCSPRSSYASHGMDASCAADRSYDIGRDDSVKPEGLSVGTWGASVEHVGACEDE